MTNTTETHPSIVAKRGDEVRFLTDLAAVAFEFRVLRVGAFLPGGDASYDSAFVLRDVSTPTKTEFVVCYAVAQDDTESVVLRWVFSSGHYFGSYELAVERLAERSAGVEWVRG